MPDPLLYGKTLAAAALASLLIGLAIRLSARRWPAARGPATALLGTALAIVVGFAVLGVHPRLPPQNGLDRFLSVVLPAALVVEFLASLPRVPTVVATCMRMTCAASAGWILWYGSVYLRPGAGEWTIGEASGALTVCAAGLYVEGELVSRLGRRAGDTTMLLALSLAILCAGVLVMLAGYLKGGTAAFPLAAALFGSALICWRTPNRGALGLGVVSLFGLLFIGRFFGGLSTGTALVVFAAPLLGWLPEALPEALSKALPEPTGGRGERTWKHSALQLALVAIPLVFALVRAKFEFDRKLGPLVRQPPLFTAVADHWACMPRRALEAVVRVPGSEPQRAWTGEKTHHGDGSVFRIR